MSAIVFCLKCNQVLDITEYLHPGHRCASQHRHPSTRPKQPTIPLLGDDGDDVA